MGITVWPGYAVQVVSKDGTTRVVTGHAHTILKFDETLTVMQFSTGNPKNDGRSTQSPYLKVRNNRVSDTIDAETRDMVKVKIGVAFQVNFEGENQDAWFTVSDYVQLLSERMRSIVRAAVKEVTIEELINQSASLVRDAVLGKKGDTGEKRPGYSFDENGMRVTDVEVLTAQVADSTVAQLLAANQQKAVSLSLQVTAAEAEEAATRRLEQARQEKAKLTQETLLAEVALAIERAAREKERDLAQAAGSHELTKLRLANQLAEAQAEEGVAAVQRQTSKADAELELEQGKAAQALELEKLAAEVKAHADRFAAISPELVAAITALSDKDTAIRMSTALAPVALMQGMSVSELLSRFLKDSALGDAFQQDFKQAQANNEDLATS